MNMTIKEINYFSRNTLFEEASFLSKLYPALLFCKKEIRLTEKADEIMEFVKYFFVYDSSKWIVDLRFCTEECDFIIRIPWLLVNHQHNVYISERVLILASADSSIHHCKNATNRFIDVLWNEFCHCGVREQNIGQIPKEILYLERGGLKYIPRWYIRIRAYLERFRFGCDNVRSWLEAEKYFLDQGFHFS